MVEGLEEILMVSIGVVRPKMFIQESTEHDDHCGDDEGSKATLRTGIQRIQQDKTLATSCP